MTACIVVGMEAEAEIVRQACPKALVVVGAGDAALLRDRLDAALGQDAIKIDRILSAGICGGLNPELPAGAIVVGGAAVYGLSVVACDPNWSARMWTVLSDVPASWRKGMVRFTISETAVARMADKTALRAFNGADVVDEETFLAGSIAAARGLPFAALRTISDPASFELPPAALVKLTASGADDMGAILRSIAGDPFQIPELFELAALSARAMGALRAALARVGDFAAYA